jgi:hypothetical protein
MILPGWDGLHADIERENCRPGFVEKLGVLGCLVSACLFVAMCWRGLDLTDEGFYLNWIKSPSEYSFSVSSFGFFFHPLALVLPDNIAMWRIAGMLLLLAASVVFHGALLGYAYKSNGDGRRVGWTTYACMVVSSLAFYAEWVPTPNYNLLNLSGCLLFAGGLLLISTETCDDSASFRTTAIGVAALAVAAIMIWMARPSTLLACGAYAVVWMLLHGWRRILFAGSFAAVVAAAGLAIVSLTIDGSLEASLQRYRLGVEIVGLFQPNSFRESLISQFNFPLPAGSTYEFGFATASFMLLLGALSRFFGGNTPNSVIAGLLAVIIGVTAWRTLSSSLPWVPRLFPFAALLAVGAILAMRRRSAGVPSLPVLAALLTASMPLAFGIGSTNKIEYMAGLSSTFWIGSAVLLLLAAGKPSDRYVNASILAACFATITVVHLISAAATPYRAVAPLWEQSSCIPSGSDRATICLDAKSAAYVMALRAEASTAGFTPGTALIDLTGTAPTTVFMLGGTAIGAPWLIGGYQTSAEFVRRSLALLSPAQRERAWVLSAPAGHRPIPAGVMQQVGLDFPNSYREVARAVTGYQNEVHVLWKPRR